MSNKLSWSSTISELANQFNVDEQTVEDYLNTYPELHNHIVNKYSIVDISRAFRLSISQVCYILHCCGIHRHSNIQEEVYTCSEIIDYFSSSKEFLNNYFCDN